MENKKKSDNLDIKGFANKNFARVTVVSGTLIYILSSFITWSFHSIVLFFTTIYGMYHLFVPFIIRCYYTVLEFIYGEDIRLYAAPIVCDKQSSGIGALFEWIKNSGPLIATILIIVVIFYLFVSIFPGIDKSIEEWYKKLVGLDKNENSQVSTVISKLIIFGIAFMIFSYIKSSSGLLNYFLSSSK